MNAPATIGRSGWGPVQENERVDEVDVLRGFALLGILLVNIGYFAFPVSEPFYLPPSSDALDKGVHWLVTVLAQGKFYPLFSLLFGMGFAMQLQRLHDRGNGPQGLLARRLFILLLLGLGHGVFVWAGDILAVYALLGFVLLLFADASLRTLLVCTLTVITMQLALVGAFTLMLSIIHAGTLGDEMLIELNRAMDEAAVLRADAWSAYATGSYLDVVHVRVREFGLMLQNTAWFGPQVLGMFLLGAWLGRRGVVTHPLRHVRLLKSMLVVGAAAGLPLSIVYARVNGAIDYHAIPTPSTGYALLLNIAAGLLMALAYLAAITLMMQTRMGNRLRWLAPAGRMALSNYLLQSITATLIFYSYGLGWFGTLSIAELVLLALVIFSLQVVLSHWWIHRYLFGPAEWFWRSLTYGEMQPMRRKQVEVSAER